MSEGIQAIANTEGENSKMLAADQKTAGGRNGPRTAYNDFVRKLFAILESGDYTSIISWTKEGNSFVVVDTNKFTTNILPKHFKHSNFSSFVRQLNKYDFHKVKRTPEERQHSEYGEYSWEFQHPRFRRNDEAALDRIKRKTVTQKKVALTEDIIGGHRRNGTSDGGLISTAELTATTNMVLNNCVSKAKFNQLKKRTDNMELFNQQLQAENSNLQIEFQKLAAKCNAMMDNIFALKSINDTLLGNFNSLVSTLAQQGIKLPHDLQGVDQSFSQGSGGPSPVASQSTMHAATLETAPPSSIPAASPCASKSLPPVDSVALRPGFHVLLVEDNSVCIELCCKFLRKYGCSVEVVTDGLSAIETIEKFRFDLVLMDIVMPNLDGATATSVIRGFDNQTPIIAMTANIEDQDLVTYLQHGMNDILAKPFTKDDLHSMLIRYLNDRVPLTEQANIANQGLATQRLTTQGLATQHASV